MANYFLPQNTTNLLLSLTLQRTRRSKITRTTHFQVNQESGSRRNLLHRKELSGVLITNPRSTKTLFEL